MLAEIFKSIIIASVMGGMLGTVLLLTKPLTCRAFGAGWRFYLWLSVLLVFVCPIRLENSVVMPKPIHNTVNALTVKAVPTLSFFEDKGGVYMKEATPDNAEYVNFLALIWMTVAVILLLKKICHYLLLKRKLFANSVPKASRMGIVIRQCDLLGAPLVFGCLKPVLYLPESILDSEYMEYIMAHERVHIARKDVWVKWFSAIVKCIHWFNPAVYMVARRISKDCEVACDIRASRDMSGEERKKYMQTILDISENEVGFKKAFSVGLTAEGRCLKERLLAVQSAKKTSAVMHISGAILFCLLTVTATAAVGILSGNIVSGTQNEYRLIAKRPENARNEALLNTDKTEMTNSVAESPDMTEPTEEEIMVEERADQGEKNQEPEADVVAEPITEPAVREKPVIRGEFNSDKGDTRCIYGVTADENGCITVEIHSNTQETVDVYISDSQSGREVHSMGVPVPYEAAYLMEGLEPGKSYDIVLKGEMRKDWNIESEYMIY